MPKKVNLESKKAVLIGFGNIYRQDDGVALYILEKLKQRQFANLELINGSLGGVSLFDFLLTKTATQKVILLDAAEAGLEPGTVFLADLKNLNAWPRLSLHQLPLNFILSLLGEEKLAKIKFIAVQPAKVGFGLGLSKLLKERFWQIEKKVVSLVEAELKKRPDMASI